MPKVEILEQKGYHFLWINDELWMWDVPQEIEDQSEIAQEAFGNVLVAGYGLGIVQKCLLQNPKVKSVLTVELHKEVIEACKRVFGKINGKIIVADFFKYFSENKFNCVIGDIWIDQSKNCIPIYLKFKNHAQRLLKSKGKILGWGMDYMEYLVKKHSEE